MYHTLHNRLAYMFQLYFS